jgi:hypothetical protein
LTVLAIATVAALAASAVFAASTALLHRSAGMVAKVTAGKGVARFVVSTSVHPVWLAGMVGQLVGFGLHALALHDGPLTLVQPLMVTEVVFALPLRQLLEARRPRRSELAWATLLCCGLAGFLAAATPAQGSPHTPDPLPTALTVALVSSGMAICAYLGRRAQGTWPAAMLGVGAGLGFAGTAGALKQVTVELNGGLALVFTSWPVYALALAGATGMLLTELAFKAGPLSASLPAMSTVDTVVSLVIGVAVFDEPFRLNALALFGEVTGLVVVVVGLAGLAAVEGPRQPKPGAEQLAPGRPADEAREDAIRAT